MTAKKNANAEIQEIAETVVKGKGKGLRPNRSENLKVQADPGDNSKFLNNSLELYRLPKISMQNVQEVDKRIDEYFDICAKNDVKPSKEGLALAFGISRVYLWELETGAKGKNPDVANSIKKASQLINVQMVDYMQNGKINPVSGIFLMKNNFGYADKQEVVVTPNNPLGDGQDEKQLEEKYQESVIDVEAEDVD